jgi:dihydrofolate reductase
MSRRAGFIAAGCDVVSSVKDALETAGDVDEVMVIGGGAVYELFLPQAERIYLTRVQADVDGDTFFPKIDRDEWRVTETESFPMSAARKIAYTFENLQRRSTAGSRYS